jgi:hypothetical protein
MSSYTFVMHSTKYIIIQEENGWRGYLEGYPEHEIYGESFEELQFKLWQLHQELTTQESEQDLYQKREHDRYHEHSHTPTMQPPTMPRPMTRAQIKRRARVEQLVFAMISNR